MSSSNTYTPILWHISALHNRLKAGNSLESGDYRKIIPLRNLESLILDCEQIPNDVFYIRQKYKDRNDFVAAFNRVSIALLKPIYKDLKQTDRPEIALDLIGRIVETICASDLPSGSPPSRKLLEVLGEQSAEDFKKAVEIPATDYAKMNLKTVIYGHEITHVPEDSVFASQENILNPLNYIFSKATEQQFRSIATAIELSGKDFEDEEWLSGLLVGKYAAPDFVL